MHEGNVHASSEGLGKGSEFVVRLPVIESEPQTPAVDNTGAADLIDLRPKVLVVDDNGDAADTLQVLVEMENCKVATSHDGHEAVLATRRAMPDMIVMDSGMPRMEGYQAARRIRCEPGSKEVLMIAVTGWGQVDASIIT